MSEGHDTEVDSEGESRDTISVPRGRALPLNSKRLTAVHVRQLANALDLPTSGSVDQLWQLVEGKLMSESGREVCNVQVIVQETAKFESKLSLVDERGVFLETMPHTSTGEEASSELEVALEEATQQNTELSAELESVRNLLEKEKEHTASLTERLETATTDHEGSSSEVSKLKAELKAEKDRAKQLWRMSCEQVKEQDEEIERLNAKIKELEASAVRRSSSSSERSSPDPL